MRAVDVSYVGHIYLLVGLACPTHQRSIWPTRLVASVRFLFMLENESQFVYNTTRHFTCTQLEVQWKSVMHIIIVALIGISSIETIAHMYNYCIFEGGRMDARDCALILLL